MSGLSHCVECGQRLHNAFFCPQCSQPSCSWRCFQHHRDRHAVPTPQRKDGPPPKPDHDNPDPPGNRPENRSSRTRPW